MLVTCYLALGELNTASEFADELIEMFPVSGSFLQRALVNEAQGRTHEAAADFEAAAEREEPGGPEEGAKLRALWGRFYLRLGHLDAAERLLRESLRIAPNNVLGLTYAGDLAMRRGRPNEAATRFIDAFGVARQARYLVWFARAKQAAGDTRAADDARDQAEKLLRRDLQTGRYGHRLDLVELLLDRARPADVAEAVKLSEAELDVRKSADAWFAVARSRDLAGKHDEAARAVRAALRTGARRPEMYAWAARIEHERKREAQAKVYEGLARQEGAPAGGGGDEVL